MIRESYDHGLTLILAQKFYVRWTEQGGILIKNGRPVYGAPL